MKTDDMVVGEASGQELLALPTYPERTDAQLEHVATRVLERFADRRSAAGERSRSM